MKMLIGGLAAAFMATVAIAQTPPPPADPMTSAPTTSPASPPADAMAPAAPAAKPAPALTQKDGKWWNGDRKATKTEIAEYKAANPQ